ncbi:MAG TPA: glycosyltransferase family 1 protein [Acidimicrobiales bacterium]|jgi:glycosyltransferase involved in cell wall biosynthesis|nr:glycosyltransferase family 1 protein [Acidimicrobiales bacterium]
MIRVALDGEPLLGRRTGVGNFCAGLIEGLAALGDIEVNVFAVTWRMRDELARQLPAGAQVIGRPMPARPVRAVWEAGVAMPLELFTGRLDLVHGTNSIVPPTWRAAQVVTVHDLSPLRFPEVCEPATLVYPDFIRRAVRRGAWVHTDSQFVAEEVVEAFGADPDRVRAIHPGIPVLADPTTAPDLGSIGRYILAVGTIEPRKDYPGLVKAFDALAGARPDLGLVIVGSEAWGSERFHEALAACAHRDRVIRPGYLGDGALAALLHGAAVLAYPSRYEGFGFPPLQAMAAGVPVVATAAGSVPEVVGNAAVTVPVGDADALSAALAQVLDDPTVAAGLVDAGRRHVTRFSWDSLAMQMSALYGEVLSPPDRR